MPLYTHIVVVNMSLRDGARARSQRPLTACACVLSLAALIRDA